jgi:ferredoxin-NADP reductase
MGGRLKSTKNMIQKTRMPIILRKEIAEDTFEIRFGLKENFDYKAGQYVNIKIDPRAKDGRGSIRAFSLSSSPRNKKFISTCFRLPNKHSEFKEYLTTCEIGSEVMVVGPRGKFTLPLTSDKPIVMIAGGVGIVPFMSMIRFATETRSSQDILLLYTDKSEVRMAYFDSLTELEAKNSHFRFRNRNKRVDEKFIRKHSDVEQSLFYVCGTPGMIKGVITLLKRMGVTEDRIRFEEFSGY